MKPEIIVREKKVTKSLSDYLLLGKLLAVSNLLPSLVTCTTNSPSSFPRAILSWSMILRGGGERKKKDRYFSLEILLQQ